MLLLKPPIPDEFWAQIAHILLFVEAAVGTIHLHITQAIMIIWVDAFEILIWNDKLL